MAYKKKCPECGEYSYSASEKGMWRCATCGADITDVKVEQAGSDNGEKISDSKGGENGNNPN